ncbi:MAG: sigma-70 family RNA polymerase sigma factor [Pedobacter sp.]|nr:MAG: sigma-70 family RNA polymerase sigma factor [Pedobacter sp.]
MRANSLQEDLDLMVALQGEGQVAFQIIFDTYWKELYKASYYRIRDQSAAEDIVQDVFTDLWDKRHSIRIETSLSSYLQASLKYRIIRLFNRSSLHQNAIDHLMGRMTEMEQAIFDALEYNDLERTISQTINSFPENMRNIFLLRSEELTIREIADALGLAEQSVKNNVSEGLKRLKIVLLRTDPDFKRSLYLLLVTIMLEE